MDLTKLDQKSVKILFWNSKSVMLKLAQILCVCVCVLRKRRIAVVLLFTNISTAFCSLLCKSWKELFFANSVHVISRLKIIDNQALRHKL